MSDNKLRVRWGRRLTSRVSRLTVVSFNRSANMGYAISPFAVPLKSIEALMATATGGVFSRLFGTRHNALLKQIKQDHSYRFEQDDVDEDDEPTLEQALTALVAQKTLHPTFGHKYAYAFELLCAHFGERLDNSAWSAMRIEWAEDIDEAMLRVGIDKNAMSVLSHLLHRGAPVSIPAPADFPAVGYLRKDETKRAAAAIDAADLSSMDHASRASVEQILNWCQRCFELNRDLVCFYY